MHLAKDGLDIGLLTTDATMVPFFRDTVALGEPEVLPISEHVTQYRFAVGRSVIKVNVAPATGTARTGYRGVIVARDGPTRVPLVGPDGVEVTLAPPTEMDGANLAIRLAVPDLEAAHEWFASVLGWPAPARDVIRVGTTTLLLELDPTIEPTAAGGTVGWTYLTVQIHDCVAEVEELAAAGAHIASPVRDLGEVARFAMVADPFGNQLEISQRASITGPLGEMPLPAGGFSDWLAQTRLALRGVRDADVPCDGCTACCTASQFVPIAPDEVDTLAHIPAELLFPAPRAPKGHVLLGYDERGHCPMLVEGACSIYEHRPRTCRTYDCRVFPATAIAPDEDDATKVHIAARAAQWRFRHPTERDRREHDALLATAESLRGELPNATARAVRAIELQAADQG